MDFNYMEYAFKALKDVKDIDFDYEEPKLEEKQKLKESLECEDTDIKRYKVFIFAEDNCDDFDATNNFEFTSKEEAEAYAKEMKELGKFYKIVVREYTIGDDCEIKCKDILTESLKESKDDEEKEEKSVTVSLTAPDKEKVDLANEIIEKNDEKEDEEDKVQVVLDVDADNLAEIKDKDYMGKYIIKCPVCDTLIYKDLEQLHKSEEKDEDGNPLFNIDEECPHCHVTDEGFLVVGQVGKPDLDSEEEVEVKDEVEVKEDETIEEDVKDTKEAEEEKVDIESETGDKGMEKVDIEDKKVDIKDEEELDPLEVLKDKLDIHGEKDKIIIAEKGKLDDEEAVKIEIKVTDKEFDCLAKVFHEDKEEAEDAEIIQDVETSTEEESKKEDTNEIEDKVEESIEDFDDERFNALVEQYLSDATDTEHKFESTKCSYNATKKEFVVEGLIDGKDTAKFVFNNKQRLHTGRYCLSGINEGLENNRIEIIGSLKEGKFTPKKISYAVKLKESKVKTGKYILND